MDLLENIKVQIVDSTQVPVGKGWFCMLIFEVLHSIVHVTLKNSEVPPLH